jgi:coenzyme F420-0:L-glutamate ligase/coenzyme F420-1:gamma-L-glutamate ligase
VAEAPRLEILGVPGLPDVRAGDDLAAVILVGLATAGITLLDGDLVVVSSKVVSKAEGRVVAGPNRDAAVEAETVRVVAERVSERGLTRIVASRSGPVLAAAGVDASNVPAGTYLALPADPDAGARALRSGLTASGVRVGVVVSDTAGRPWRDGQVDFAVGAAGILVIDDLRGAVDGFGNALEVTVRALADELASAADLVKGKLAGVPVAVLRGLASLVTADDGPGARALLRTPDTDWFALGHVEAVRSAMGAPPGTAGVELVPMVPDGAGARLRRAVAVALAGSPPLGELPPVSVAVDDGGDGWATATVMPCGTGTDDEALLALGALVQRLVAASWAEGLVTECDRISEPEMRLIVTSRLRAPQ